MFISEDVIVPLLGLNPAQQRHCHRESLLYHVNHWCPCFSFSMQPLQSQHCLLSPAETATLQCCFLPPPPSSCSDLQIQGDTQLSLGHLWSQGNSFEVYAVLPPWRWFWLLQCLLNSGKAFNCIPTFPCTEGHISVFKLAAPTALQAPAGTAPLALPASRVSVLSIGSCFLAAALR